MMMRQMLFAHKNDSWGDYYRLFWRIVDLGDRQTPRQCLPESMEEVFSRVWPGWQQTSDDWENELPSSDSKNSSITARSRQTKSSLRCSINI